MKALTESNTGKGFFIRQMAQVQGVAEALKVADPMEWVRKMNNIRETAVEIVNAEIIFAQYAPGGRSSDCPSDLYLSDGNSVGIMVDNHISEYLRFYFCLEERTMLETGAIYLIVRDFNQSVSFYKQLLEKNVSSQNKTRFAIFNVGNLCLCLLNGKFDAEHPDQVEHAGGLAPLFDDLVAVTEKQNSGKIVINLGTPDLRKEYERVKELHIASDMTEIRYINAGRPYWYFCLRDPDGNVIEITGGYAPEGGTL